MEQAQTEAIDQFLEPLCTRSNSPEQNADQLEILQTLAWFTRDPQLQSRAGDCYLRLSQELAINVFTQSLEKD